MHVLNLMIHIFFIASAVASIWVIVGACARGIRRYLAVRRQLAELEHD